MGISAVQSGQGVYSPDFAQKSSKHSSELPFSRTTETDTVNISEKAKALSQKAQAAKIAAEQPDPATEISYDDLPLEAFSLPGWFAEWSPDEAVLSFEVGLSLSAPHYARNDSLNSERQDELGEYLDILYECFQEELDNHGIKNSVDYYKSVFLDKEKSEEVHQSMKKRLADDLRAMELMQSFGRTLYPPP